MKDNVSICQTSEYACYLPIIPAPTMTMLCFSSDIIAVLDRLLNFENPVDLSRSDRQKILEMSSNFLEISAQLQGGKSWRSRIEFNVFRGLSQVTVCLMNTLS